MPKYLKDFLVTAKRVLPSGSALLTVTTSDGSVLEGVAPGQFAEVKIDSPSTFLRRPISICNFRNGREIDLFVKPVGEGSRCLTSMNVGDKVEMMLPLGHGFSCEATDVRGKRVLLVGGGVGAAPLVFLSDALADNGADVSVIIGGRSAKDVEGVTDLYARSAHTFVTTDDGSSGHPGIVTAHPSFSQPFDRIYCCGPTPMMKAVARIAAERSIWCEVSLENMMACGLGACLCCVEETSDEGNVCVCTEGPVFNINRLKKWL